MNGMCVFYLCVQYKCQGLQTEICGCIEISISERFSVWVFCRGQTCASMFSFSILGQLALLQPPPCCQSLDQPSHAKWAWNGLRTAALPEGDCLQVFSGAYR